MSSAKLTLIGLYAYYQSHSDDLFKNLSLPDGIDKQTVIDNILLKGGEFESLYGDPSFIQEAIGVWSNKWNRTFTKWIDALNIDYDPLENYDRREDWSDTSNGSASGSSTDSGTNTALISAENSYGFQNDNQSSSNSNSSSNTSTSNTQTHSGRLHGNIGVTTSQQMLEAELDIAEWSIYEHITDMFLSEFVIPIY